MRAFTALFRIRLIAGFQYRAAAWAGSVTQFFWGFMYIMIYEAFYRGSAAPMPMEFSQMCSYLWLQQAFLALIFVWVRDTDLLELITGGGVAYELCRPSPLYGMWFSRLLAMRLSGAALRCLPIFAVAAFLPAPYRLTLPPDAAHMLLFIPALAAAALLSTALSALIYIITISTMNSTGVFTLFSVVADFFSGSLIALPFMPRAVQNIAYVLPFRYIADFPLRFYTGNIPVGEGLISLGVSLFWIAALILAGEGLMRRALRKLVVQGG